MTPWVYNCTMYGSRRLALLGATAALVVAPVAEAKPAARVDFRLSARSGFSSVRVITVRIVRRKPARAAAARLDLRVTLRNRASLPSDLLLSAEVLRTSPTRASIVIAAFRPQELGGEPDRAQAAQAAVTVTGAAGFATGYDVDQLSSDGYETDWTGAVPDFPARCLIGTRLADDQLNPYAGRDFAPRPSAHDVFRRFVTAVCRRGPRGIFRAFMRGDDLLGATPPAIGMRQLPDNPFEAGIHLEDDIVFTEVKVEATGSNSFSDCLSVGGGPCEVHDPGTPGNFVTFPYRGGASATAEFHVRSGTAPYADWGTVNVYVLPLGEPEYEGPFPQRP